MPLDNLPARPALSPEISPEVRRIVEAMVDSVRQYNDNARSLPSAAYTSQEFYEFEKEAIFMKSWLALGHQNQIPKAGDYFTVEIADEPLIVVRQKDMSIKVLSAICQHRGHPLIFNCEEEKTGNCAAFTCPYHSWTYDINGGLRGAPQMGKTIPIAQQREDTHLPELKVELFHGFVFANFDPHAAPLAPTMAKADAELRNYHFEDMVVQPTQSFLDNPWNWKITLENGLEPYHTDYVHRGIHEGAPAENAQFSDFQDWKEGDNYVTHLTWYEGKIPNSALNPLGKIIFPALKDLSDEERSRVIFSAAPPTLFFCLLADQAFTFRVFPRAANRMDLLVNFYYPKETTQLRNFQWMRQMQVATTGAFGEQDDLTNKTMQKAFKSRFAPRGRYSHLEAILPEFNRWLFQNYTRYIAQKG